MASKVNVKFVVILSSVLLLVFAGVAATALFVLTKSGEDYLQMGNEAMAAEDYKLAEKYYSKAVNHDIQNMEYLIKWRDSLEHYAPELRADYEKKFREYFSVHQAIAQAGRTDIDLHMRNLDYQWEAMIRGLGSPSGMVESVTTAAVFLAGMPPDDTSWHTILRYRGMAQVFRLQTGQQLDESEITQAKDDLRRALAADPDDGEAVVALAQIAALTFRGAVARNGLDEEAVGHAQHAIGLLESFIGNHPHDSRARLTLQLLQLDSDIRQALGLDTDITREALGIELTDIAQDIRAMDPASVKLALLRPFYRAELIQTGMPREVILTRSIVDGLIEARPQNARIRNFRAELMASAGEIATAITELQIIVDMPNLPIGLEGWWLLDARDRAVYRQMSLAFNLWEKAATEEDKAAAVTQLERYKDELGKRLPSDSPRLEMARAQLAFATGDRGLARRLLESYARQTDYGDPQALWLLAKTAIQVRNWADARENLERLGRLKPGDIKTMLELAMVYTQLGNVEGALRIFDVLAEANPDNEFVTTNRNLLRARAGLGSSGDPVKDAIISAGRIYNGTALTPGDTQAAIDYLIETVDELGLDPLLTLQLVSMQLEIGLIDEAKETLRRGLEVAPDDQYLAQLVPILDADDPMGARLMIIDARPIDELSKLVSKSRIFALDGDDEQAMVLLRQAQQINPDDGAVVELLFQASLRTGDLTSAQTLAAHARELDLDTVGGLAYDARLADARGDRDEALELMRQATVKAPDNVAVLQALGRLEMGQGRTIAGLATYRRAMELRGNDSRLVADFVRQLLILGRNEEALEVLRAAAPHIKGNRALLDQRLGLEALVGDAALALASRRSILASDPDDMKNKAALANLLMDGALWDEARAHIDDLRATSDELSFAALDARWYARQGKVAKAKEVLTAYMSGLLSADMDRNMAGPYLALGALLLEYGDTANGLETMKSAADRYDDETMWVHKILSDWQMRMGDFENAAASALAIVDAGQDDDKNTHLKRLMRALVSSSRADEARAYVDELDERRSLDPDVLIIESEIASALGETRRARELLDEAVRLFASSRRVFERRAILILQQADEVGSDQLYRDAIGDLDRAIRLEPRAWRSLQLRGYARLRLGEEASGLNDSRAAVLANDHNDEMLTVVMREFINRGQSFEAASLASEIIDRRTGDLQLMLKCGSVFAIVGDWTRAHTFYEMAWNRTQNNDTGTLFVRSLTKGRPPRWAEANLALNKLDAIVENNPALLMSRAMVRVNLGREPAAREDALKAARTLQSRREAIGTPTVHQALRSWFEELTDTFEPEAALAVIGTLGDSSPDEDQEMIQVLKASTLVMIDDRRDEGMTLFEQVEQKSADEEMARRALHAHISALMTGQEYSQAVSVLRVGIERFPQDWQMLNNLAYTLADQLDQAEEALEYAHRAVELAPNFAEISDTLGVAQLRAGYLDEASSTLEHALILAGKTQTRPVVALHLAMVKYEQKDLAEARRYLRIIDESENEGLVLGASDKNERDELVEKINSLG